MTSLYLNGINIAYPLFIIPLSASPYLIMGFDRMTFLEVTTFKSVYIFILIAIIWGKACDRLEDFIDQKSKKYTNEKWGMRYKKRRWAFFLISVTFLMSFVPYHDERKAELKTLKMCKFRAQYPVKSMTFKSKEGVQNAYAQCFKIFENHPLEKITFSHDRFSEKNLEDLLHFLKSTKHNIKTIEISSKSVPGNLIEELAKLPLDDGLKIFLWELNEISTIKLLRESPIIEQMYSLNKKKFYPPEPYITISSTAKTRFSWRIREKNILNLH